MVFVLVNNYNDDAIVSITRADQAGDITTKMSLGPKETIVVSEQPKNRNPYTVQAVNNKDEIININNEVSFRLIPQDNFGALEVLYINRKTSGRFSNSSNSSFIIILTCFHWEFVENNALCIGSLHFRVDYIKYL